MSWYQQKLKDLAFPAYEECGPIELLILQPTPFCNIDCSYCYLKGRSDKSKMSLDTVKAAYRLAFGSGLTRVPLTIAWHAGEPLTAGLSFFQEAVDACHAVVPKGSTVTHSFQTNGTLIDDKWASFFKTHKVRVGISIDGPEFIHDRFRKTRSGQGTHKRTIEGINYLNEAGVSFHTISVLTRASLQHPEEIVDHLLALGSDYICFNLDEVEAYNQTSSLQSPDPQSVRDEYFAFMRSVLDYAGKSRRPVRIREVDGALAAIAAWDGRNRSMIIGNSQQTHPFKIVTVGYEGGFSSYSPELLGEAFAPYKTFELGNVHASSLKDAYHTPLFRTLYKDIQGGIDRCRGECAYFQFCGGGTPANKLYENGSFSSSETLFCRLHRKATIDAVLSAFASQ
jgi:uncharacterized protein